MERVRAVKGIRIFILAFALFVGNVPIVVNAATLDDTVTIGTPFALTTLNPFSANAGALNSEIQSLTSMGFNYWSKDLQKVQNTQFGSYSIQSYSPLSIRFTVRSGAQWSDGTPISAIDLLFSHLISSTAYAQSAGLIGLAANTKPTFDSKNYGNYYDKALVQTPLISADKQSLTLFYGQSFPDWELFTPTPFPVHALVLMSNGASGLQNQAQNAAAKSMFESAFQNRNTALLKKYAATLDAFYNIK